VPTEKAVRSYVDGQISTITGTDLSKYTLTSDFTALSGTVTDIQNNYLSTSVAANTYATTADVTSLSGTVTGIQNNYLSTSVAAQTYATVDALNAKADSSGNPAIDFQARSLSIDIGTDDPTRKSVRCEHHGSNFIVRPAAAGSNVTVIENTGGGGLSIQPSGSNTTFGGNVIVASDWLQISPVDDGGGLNIAREANDGSNTQLVLTISTATSTAEGYANIQAISRSGGQGRSGRWGDLYLNEGGGNVIIGKESDPNVGVYLMQVCPSVQSSSQFLTVPQSITDLLQDMPNSTVLFGGCKGHYIFFYWKDESGHTHVATISDGEHNT
jgi:hypothetical protein